MSSPPPNASNDEIEEELVFLDVLITSLDPGADDYAEKLVTFQGKKERLERRLEGSQGGSRPQTSEQQIHMDHMPAMTSQNHGNGNGWWQTTLNGRPGSTGSQTSFNGGPPYDMNFNAGMNSFSNNPDMGSTSNFNMGNMNYGSTSNMDMSVRNHFNNFNMANMNSQPPAMKRAFPYSVQQESLHPSKRPTPEPSNAATPASSTSSFELLDHSGTELSERTIRRQMEAEAALRRRREAQLSDEEYARSLSQQDPQSSAFASSSRPSIQTTLSFDQNGSYQRPQPRPQPQPEPQISQRYGNQVQYPNLHLPNPNMNAASQADPSIKQEPGFRRPQQSTMNSREPEVIDLTNSDDEEDLSEIPPTYFSPSRQMEYRPNPLARPAPPTQPMLPMRPQQTSQLPQMPGSYPSSSAYQSVYGNTANVTQARYPWMPAPQQSNPLLSGAMNAVSGIKNVANALGSTWQELGNLVNGSRSRPWSLEDEDTDDDDVVFGGSRQLNPRPTPYAGYSDMDLYNQRAAALQHYDPMKTSEEINTLLENIRPDEEMPAHLRVKTPDDMAVQLHKYQELGLTWLQKQEDGSNKGGILADDMGLGKTIQMLALMVTRRSEDIRCKTTLIVAPVALMRQWRQEIEQKIRPPRRFSIWTHHGQAKKKSFRELQTFDVVLTTYGSLAAELKKLESFRMRRQKYPESRPEPCSTEQCALISEDATWYRVILDEAQCIKNDKTQTAKAACILKAKSRFCMTGTPMMNTVSELFSLIKFLRIKPYNDWGKFRLDFVTPLKSGHDNTREKSMRMLQTLCKAIMLRRTKTSTFEGKPILNLPERTTEVQNPEFSEDEESFYRALENRTQLQFNKYLRAGTVGTSYSAILVLLLRLRQACCHPHLIKDFGVSAAADVSPEDLIELAKSLDPQVVERIKSTGGSFECPVCYDGVTNPAIFIPCGHDTCSDCFARIADPANAIRDGNENATNAKCPNCRAAIDPKRITDFESFKKVHMPELLNEQEQQELEELRAALAGENGDDESDDKSDDSDTDSDEDEEGDDVDEKGNLKDFIVGDDEVESEAESGNDEEVKLEDREEEGAADPSTKISKGKGKAKQSKLPKAKRGKGKKKEKKAKKKKSAVTLADLKKLAGRNSKARKQYLKRLREDWMSSAKIEKTMEALRTIMEDHAGEKVLIFSQWTSLLDLLEIPIDEAEWGYRRYDGSMNPKSRGDAVDDFRDPRQNIRIMLVSLKAGNAGLNLNAANNVIILDPFWNPYIEEQAIDRAHRLGQQRAVKVQRILVPNTVEDRIIELQEKKRALISEALDEKAGQNIARLGVQELAYLFGVTRNANQRVDYVPRGGR